ncbi:MAG: glycosyltransferase family 4 protein, partial [Chloroflexota bacterium]|nr:glycosyltransferase family 4 protein [Chloroflexota bacterium]
MTAKRALHVHLLIDSLGLGGAEALVADFVIGAQQAGVEVSVGHLHPAGEAAERLRETGIEPVRVPVHSLLGSSDRRAVREHLAAVRPHLLHTHLGYSDLLGGLAARALGIGSVSTLHLAHWGGTPRERVKFHLAATTRRRCAARVIAVSEAARRSYLAAGWDREERVVAVHNGIVDAARPGSGGRIRRELGIGSYELVLGMVGVLRGWKGHEAAAGAVERLAQRFPGVRLLVVGDGPKRNEIELATRGLGDRVLFVGYRDDVLEVLDAVDVLVHPSTYDAFPTVLLEAMAARVPVVATAVGGIPEAVVDGETGVLISGAATPHAVENALEPLLADRDLRL